MKALVEGEGFTVVYENAEVPQSTLRNPWFKAMHRLTIEVDGGSLTITSDHVGLLIGVRDAINLVLTQSGYDD